MQLPAWTRREVIEDLLDINIFSKMKGLLRERNTKIKEEITDVTHHLDILKTKTDAQNKYIKDLQSINKDMINQKTKAAEDHTKEIGLLFENSRELGKNLATEMKTAQSLSEQQSDSISQLQAKNYSYNESIKSLVKEARFYEDNDHCPTCDQAIEEDKKTEKLTIIQGNAKDVQMDMDILKKELASSNHDLATYKKQISDLQDKQRDEIKSIYLSQKTQKEFLREVIIKLLQNNDPEDIAQYFPNFEEIMGGGFKVPEEKADGGRIGYKMGSEPMMENVVEQKKETGEVQDLSYTELRTRLPQEISNEIVMLLANSKQALLDFANIQTGEDIASFNQQYDVNLSLPQGA